MNYLAHILLAGSNTEHQLGALVGDFVKGRVETLVLEYPGDLVQGIVSHRAVDRYTDHHPVFKTSRSRVSPERRRVAGIIVDVAYDHFLSLHWTRFCSRSKEEFIQDFYQILSETEHALPERLKRAAPSMIENDWLGSYEDLTMIGHVYDRISSRFRRANNLAGSLTEVQREFTNLERDFLEFFPQLMAFSEGQNLKTL